MNAKSGHQGPSLQRKQIWVVYGSEHFFNRITNIKLESLFRLADYNKFLTTILIPEKSMLNLKLVL